MKFIRVRGRIIPIKDKTGGDRAHGEFAAAGALNRVVKAATPPELVMIGGIKLAVKKPRFAMLAGLIGAGAFGASMVNSYKHGVKKDSLGAGLTRGFTNLLAFKGGSIGAGLGMKHLSKLGKVKKTALPKGATVSADFRKIE